MTLKYPKTMNPLKKFSGSATAPSLDPPPDLADLWLVKKRPDVSLSCCILLQLPSKSFTILFIFLHWWNCNTTTLTRPGVSLSCRNSSTPNWG
ncbi:hypothetical protein Hdeb2414_s0009g00301661 [Helianthus debilis subsp. tardiflorus]